MSKIAFDKEYIFNEAGSAEIAIAWLTTDTFVVAYRDQGNSNYGTAIVGTVSGNSISFGNEYVFSTSSLNVLISITALTSSKVAIIYAGSTGGEAIIGNISGTTISYGTKETFYAGAEQFSDITRLTDSKFVIVYVDEDDKGQAIIGDVADSTITFGTSYYFNNALTSQISVDRLTDSKFVVAYRDEGNSHYGTARIGDVSGTVITFGSEYVFNSAWTVEPTVVSLTDSKFAIAYGDEGNSDYGTAIVGDVSGTAISYGTEKVFDEVEVLELSTSKLSDSKFVVVYRDVVTGRGMSAIGDVIQSNNLAFSSAHPFNTNTYISAVAGIDDKKFVIAYRDGDNSFYGTTIVGTELIVYPSHGIMNNLAIF